MAYGGGTQGLWPSHSMQLSPHTAGIDKDITVPTLIRCMVTAGSVESSPMAIIETSALTKLDVSCRFSSYKYEILRSGLWKNGLL